MTTLDLSYYILSKFDDITPLKLQKLLYYTKVWGLVSGEYSIEGEFEKWSYGPVNPQAFQEFKKYKGDIIPQPDPSKIPFLNPHQKEAIDFVLDCYHPFGALTLSAMTHAEEPWDKTEKNGVISEILIKEYYSKTPFAKNFPLDLKNKPFSPVPTDMQHSFVFDIEDDNVQKYSNYSSYETYKNLTKKAEIEIKKILS